jgi:Flp pilus assembly protein TadD
MAQTESYQGAQTFEVVPGAALPTSVADKHQGAIQLYGAGRYREAFALLNDALNAGGSSELWNDWAVAALACEEVGKAEAGFRRALALDPTNGEAAVNLGALLAGLGRVAEAIPVLEIASERAPEPQRSKANQLLGDCRRQSTSRSTQLSNIVIPVGQSSVSCQSQHSMAEQVLPGSCATPRNPLPSTWESFDEIICLTLEGDTARQRQASAELCQSGMQRFSFFEGTPASSIRVTEAFAKGEVKKFPPCFRCGALECNCDNNTLIRSQVACSISFMDIFKYASRSESNTFLVVEDDVVLEDYAIDLANEALTKKHLSGLGFFDKHIPCLLRLGYLKVPGEVRTYNGTFSWSREEGFLSNPCFAFNKPFAELAIKEFKGFTHTADVYIHVELSEKAVHFGLSPKLAHDRSLSLGTAPSRIHPRPIYLECEENSAKDKELEAERISNHIKRTMVVDFGILGIPRGGTAWAAKAGQELGFQIGHEKVEANGISSWMLVATSEVAPFGFDLYAKNPGFIYPKKRILVARPLPVSLPSQIMENTKNIQSFAFRRKLIQERWKYDLAQNANQISRAILSYFLWYRLCLETEVHAIVRIGDVAGLAKSFGLPDVSPQEEQALVAKTIGVNKNKAYHGQRYERTQIDLADLLRSIRAMTAQEIGLIADTIACFPAAMKEICLGTSRELMDAMQTCVSSTVCCDSPYVEDAAEKTAAQLIAAGNPAAAVPLLAACLQQDETSERWNDWAAAEVACGRNANAETGFRRALELDPANRQAGVNLATVLILQRRFAEAAPILEPYTVTLSPHERAMLHQLATGSAHAIAPCRV